MLAKIKEPTQGAALRAELLCGEADFRTVAEAIASGIKARPNPESLGFIVRRSIGDEDRLAD